MQALPQIITAIWRGSSVLFRQKFEDRWDTGIYVGLIERSNELRLLTPQGAIKANNVKRLPPSQRSNPELLAAVRGLPWRLTPGQLEDGEVECGDARVALLRWAVALSPLVLLISAHKCPQVPLNFGRH